jgi:hypothetical protein
LTPTPTTSPTPTPTPDPQAITLNFSVKFQGITTQKAGQKVKITVHKDGLTDKVFPNVNVTANAGGLYTGQVTLARVAAGNNYAIFIKGPKHLQKKFCTNNQATRCTTTANITLTAGQNTFDFSKMELEAGDVPDPNNNNQQDGVCNTQDYSLVKNLRGNPEPAALAVGDLNLDGIVNETDTGMIRETLKTKYEEDY